MKYFQNSHLCQAQLNHIYGFVQLMGLGQADPVQKYFSNQKSGETWELVQSGDDPPSGVGTFLKTLSGIMVYLAMGNTNSK